MRDNQKYILPGGLEQHSHIIQHEFKLIGYISRQLNYSKNSFMLNSMFNI